MRIGTVACPGLPVAGPSTGCGRGAALGVGGDPASGRPLRGRVLLSCQPLWAATAVPPSEEGVAEPPGVETTTRTATIAIAASAVTAASPAADHAPAMLVRLRRAVLLGKGFWVHH